MANIDETTIRKGLEKLRLAPQEIDDVLYAPPVHFPGFHNAFIMYPHFIKWLQDFDDHTAHQLMKESNGRLYTLWHTLERYRRMKGSYERRILNELKGLMNRAAGRAILKEIQTARRLILRIRPYPAVNAADYNADARMLDEVEATHVGMPILDGSGKPKRGSGSGGGSDVVIDFSPEIWGVFSESPGNKPSRCTSCKQPTGPGSQADEVLCHELIHAGRMMRGLHYRLGVNRDYDNEEEFLAVVITNVYLAEKGRMDLRASHNGHNRLDHPEKFLDNAQHVNLSPRMLLERLRLMQMSLFQALADIPPSQAWFDPVRDYNDELKQGKGPPA